MVILSTGQITEEVGEDRDSVSYDVRKTKGEAPRSGGDGASVTRKRSRGSQRSPGIAKGATVVASRRLHRSGTPRRKRVPAKDGLKQELGRLLMFLLQSCCEGDRKQAVRYLKSTLDRFLRLRGR